jgi:hypothetical protein
VAQLRSLPLERQVTEPGHGGGLLSFGEPDPPGVTSQRCP